MTVLCFIVCYRICIVSLRLTILQENISTKPNNMCHQNRTIPFLYHFSKILFAMSQFLLNIVHARSALIVQLPYEICFLKIHLKLIWAYKISPFPAKVITLHNPFLLIVGLGAERKITFSNIFANTPRAQKMSDLLDDMFWDERFGSFPWNIVTSL